MKEFSENGGLYTSRMDEQEEVKEIKTFTPTSPIDIEIRKPLRESRPVYEVLTEEPTLEEKEILSKKRRINPIDRFINMIADRIYKIVYN